MKNVMRLTPYSYQKEGISFLLSKDKALLADDPGLGKSLQAIGAVIESGARDILIICPASLTLNWEEEIKKCLVLPFQVIQAKDSKEVMLEKNCPRFIICSYNYIQKNIERLLKKRWDVLIADEFHRCKNYRSKTTQNFLQIIKKASKIWLLTGTPATRSAEDYYTTLEVLQPGKWGTRFAFCETFCEVSDDVYGRKYTGINPNRKHVLRHVFSKLALRRRKYEVLKDLPPKINQKLYITVDQGKVLSEEDVKFLLDSEKSVPYHIQTLTKLLGQEKIEGAFEYIENIEEPILVFCRHKDVLNNLEKKLKEIGKSTDRITGDETSKEKKRAEKRFQSGEINILLLNMKAGGEGLNLTRASYVFFAELDWSPAVMTQASNRAHRIGTKNCVNVIYLVAKDTLDEQILGVLSYKSKFMEEVLSDDVYKREG